MAEVELAPNFGAELKDGFKSVNSWMTNSIAWLDDIQQFYRERSAIEKEYSQKLSALTKKYFEKKARKSSILSVGETPAVTPGSLESASMTTWGVQLTALESKAAEHDRFSNQLITALADPIRNLASRHEDLRKQHAEYAGKLEKEKDTAYADLKKTKAKYDGVCSEVEHRRKKIESSFDHGKNKAQAAYQQQLSEMRNSKNTYLIAINVTNKQKERYYHEYIPDLLDSLQSLSEARTVATNSLWLSAASIETQLLGRSTQLLEHLSSEIPRNNPLLDSMMFVRHNAGQWQEPTDLAFEPSPVWLDDEAMAVDAASKTFLINILVKSKALLGETKREGDAHRREVEGAKKVRQAIREGRDKRDEVEVMRAEFHNAELLHESERKRITAEVEISTITSAVGDISIGARNHRFKNETFRLPTNCDLCGDRIWGLSAKGMNCEDCGFTCHPKCELKVPADCPGELNKEQRKALKAERQVAAAEQLAQAPVNGSETASVAGSGRASGLQRSDTIGSMNTLSSGYAPSAHRTVSGTTVKSSMESSETAPSSSAPTPASRGPRVMAPPPSAYIKDNGRDVQPAKGKMLYAYQASGEGEISIADGQEFSLVEADDGSGWIKIKPFGPGSSAGLVPASYVEINTTSDHLAVSIAASASTTSLAGSSDNSRVATAKKKQGPTVAPRRGAKKVKHVQALYTYTANGDGEVDMAEGERMVLVAPDQGDGWCEVEARAGRGIVPAGWVTEV